MRGFFITYKGLSYLAKLQAGETMTITRVMIGDGKIQEGTNPRELSNLVNPIAQATSTVPAVKGRTVSAMIEYRNDMDGGLDRDIQINEFGVFVDDPDDGEIMLYYGNLGKYPEPVNAFAKKENAITTRRYPFVVTVNEGVEVTTAYVASAYITSDDLLQHDMDLTAHPYLAALANSAAAAIIAAVTVNVGDWKEWSGAEHETYPVCAEAAIEGASEEMYPVGTLTSESFEAAKKAGVRPVIESVKGGVRLLAKTKPSAALTACVALIGDNLGVTPGRGIKMPLASDSVIGGIKVRADSGLVIDEEGYLSVDPITSEDIEAMMGKE